MELKDEQKINASRETVYAALNDPEILQQCIPGCETLEKTSQTDMAATISLKIGPVKVKLKGTVELSNLNPPESYTITGEGKGGPAGFAKGGADIKLIEEIDGTLLQYTVTVNIGGKIAQLGTRLIDSTARKLSAEFFEKFGELVTNSEDESLGDQNKNANTGAQTQKQNTSEKSKLWLYVGAVVIILAGYGFYIM
ncbi:SRPBCC family protein [Kiloniella antarctica]|uniref:Carbon monoxide dehydrogenase subunit G n=1 Tax=Kiloniella antarctica TaxID=1550907 RepID=A0ABW5BIG2_9PROT